MKIDEFGQLLEGYQRILPHVTQWKTKTFPATVELAADIVHYDSQVPVFYGAIIRDVQKLQSNPSDQAALAQLKAVIAKMTAEAEKREKRAHDVYEAVAKFADDTSKDAVEFDRLLGVYGTKFGANSKRMADLTADLKEVTDLVETTTADYEHAKAVACSTVSYAWIVVPPIGLIAAVIVAGIYGDKAVQAWGRLQKLKNDMTALEADQRFALMLMGTLTLARDSLASIHRDINAALPSIQKIKGVWNAIYSDLKHIDATIDGDVNQAILEIKDLGIETAITQWHQLAIKADAYRANAFVEVAEERKAA
jgi:hypothetical protein